MSSAATPVPSPREPELAGQTVVLIDGSAGIGLETARRARAEGAHVILTGRHRDRLREAALDVGAQRTAAFDVGDAAAVATFFRDLPGPIDHVLITAGGPTYRPLLEMDAAEVSRALSEHVAQALEVARNAAGKMRPGGDRLEERRNELRATLPIGRVVGPADVAKLAVHIMANTALTGATYDMLGVLRPARNVASATADVARIADALGSSAVAALDWLSDHAAGS